MGRLVMETAMTAQAIEQAVRYLQTGGKAPAASDVVAALLAAEKQSKRLRQRYAYDQLLGSWQLGFVSGTQKVRPRPGAKAVKKVGKGRFLPRFINIGITYGADTVENAVTLGPLSLRLNGPTRFWPNTHSLGFDFTALQAQLGSLRLYKGDMRGGARQDELFKAQSLKDQAFFTFFILKPDYIAARGKGGGLALWTRAVG
jgi:hypothetical protein